MNFYIFHWINEAAGRYDWIDDVMEFCAQDIVWVMLGLLAILWFTGKTANQRLVFYACLSAGTALLIAGLLISPEVNHPRPFAEHAVHQLIPHAADASFPSDHSTLAFSLAFGLLLGRKRLGIIMLGLALLTGYARIYVGIHYPGDIAGALVLSFAVCAVVRLLQKRLDPIPFFMITLYNRVVHR